MRFCETGGGGVGGNGGNGGGVGGNGGGGNGGNGGGGNELLFGGYLILFTTEVSSTPKFTTRYPTCLICH